MGDIKPIRGNIELIIRTTDPLSRERASRLGDLGDLIIDRSDLRSHEEALAEAFKKIENAAEPEAHYFCFCHAVLVILGRVLDVPAADILKECLSLENVHDIIPVVERAIPPWGLNPGPEVDMALTQYSGLAYVYNFLACLLATAYARSGMAMNTVDLDRSISNFDVAIQIMQETSFTQFRETLCRIRQAVQDLQLLFEKVEQEEDPWLSSVLCGVCFDLRTIENFHTTRYPSHTMDFALVCQHAEMRCRACTILRDATASLYAVLGVAWANIEIIRYDNRSMTPPLGEDPGGFGISDLLWGRDPGHERPLEISIKSRYLGEVEWTCSFELYRLEGVPCPWKVIGAGHHISPHVASSDTWNLIEGWIQKCASSHADCQEEDKCPLPTRVIEVGADGIDPRLHISNATQHGRYAALSHCWGGVIPLCTTKDKIDEFRQGIELSKFPKTFQDAIIICRRLSLKYLWVDSLCIIQDDDDDWNAESARMSEVYQNAFITIAAAAARNSTEGCFMRRPFSIRRDFRITIASEKVEEVEIFARPWQSYHHWTKSIGDGPSQAGQHPLETRAWTLQEHLLSRRILRFSAHELVWICRTNHLCECLSGNVMDKEALRPLCLTALRKPGDVSWLGQRKTHAPMVWAETVSTFTQRSISRESDRLPAISGIAAAFSEATSFEYIGGIWKELLPGCLFWKVAANNTSRLDCSYAPTWSWASVIGAVELNKLLMSNSLPSTKIESVQWTPATKNRFGKLSDARLTITGILVNVSIAPREDDSAKFTILFPVETGFVFSDQLLDSSRAFPDIRTDSNETLELGDGTPLSCLILSAEFTGKSDVPCTIRYWGAREPTNQAAAELIGTGFDTLLCLLIKQGSGTETTYRRVGMGEIWMRPRDGKSGACYATDLLVSRGFVSTVTIL